MPDAKWYANWVRMIPAETAPEKMRNLEAADLIESLAAELEQVKRERDAAVEELDHFCDNCKYVDNAYGEEPCPSRTEYDHCDRCPGWQWRGVKED